MERHPETDWPVLRCIQRGYRSSSPLRGQRKTTTMLLGNPTDWRWRPLPEDPQAPLWYASLSVAPQPLKPSLHP